MLNLLAYVRSMMQFVLRFRSNQVPFNLTSINRLRHRRRFFCGGGESVPSDPSLHVHPAHGFLLEDEATVEGGVVEE